MAPPATTRLFEKKYTATTARGQTLHQAGRGDEARRGGLGRGAARHDCASEVCVCARARVCMYVRAFVCARVCVCMTIRFRLYIVVGKGL